MGDEETTNGSVAHQETSNALSSLERDLHQSFYASRLPRAWATFNHELLGNLDEFCSTLRACEEPVTPLSLIGPAGCGKSTLLSIWLQRRRQRLGRRPQELRIPEFCFVHVVGCTRQSVYVRELLTRLTTEIMDHFDLPRPRHFDPARLAWDLPRLLEIAGAKGRVLVVIDGLHRLRNDAGQINLKWLPTTFPANVHVVVSTTSLPPAAVDEIDRSVEGSHSVEYKIKKKMLSELERRHWRLLTMTSLSPTVRTSILDNFLTAKEAPICKSSEADNGDDFIFSLAEQLVANKKSEEAPDAPETATNAELQQLNLFEMQYQTLLAVPTNALTLATFLRALSCSAARGFDVWELIEGWLQKAAVTSATTDDVAAPLFEAVLVSWEVGHVAMEHKRAQARRFSMQAGPTLAAVAKTLQSRVDQGGDDFARAVNPISGDDDENTSITSLSNVSRARKDIRARVALEIAGSEDAIFRNTAEEAAARDVEQKIGGGAADNVETTQQSARQKQHPSCLATGDMDEKQDEDDEEYGEESFEEDYGEDFDAESGAFNEAPEQSDIEPLAPAADEKKSDLHEVTIVDPARLSPSEDERLTAKSETRSEEPSCSVAETSTMASSTLDDVPDYLLGGVDNVPGLGMLLGDGLAFLYVARYGLREDELMALLGELKADRKRERADDGNTINIEGREELDDLVDVAKVTNDSEDVLAAKELPRLLQALGVIRDESGVFVLPLESEALRTVVKRRYIDDGPLKRTKNPKTSKVPSPTRPRSSEETTTGGDRWHARLASFFARQIPSGRRAEELPWHLKHCRQWSSLCDTLANIPTFETMFHGSPQMRHELQAYWRLLAEGPLYLTRRAERKAAIVDTDLTPSQKLLEGLDVAHGLGQLESKARRERLANKSATFDVVDAYNKAIEAWFAAEHPTTHRLAEALGAIAEFMQEFDERIETPLFLRGAVNWAKLADLGVVDPERPRLSIPASPTTVRVSATAPPTSPQSDAQISAAAEDHDVGATTGYEPPRAGGVVSMSELLANVRGADGLHASAAQPCANQEKKQLSRATTTIAAIGVGNLYCYQRWMWVQFPWLALARATATSWTIGQRYAPKELASNTVVESDRNNKKNNNNNKPEYEPVLLNTAPATRALQAASSAVVNCASGPRRYWDVKRCDPSAAPVATVSEKRLRSRIFAGTSRSVNMELLKRDAETVALQGPQLEDAALEASEALKASISKASPADRKALRLRRVAARLPPRRMRWKPTATAMPRSASIDAFDPARHPDVDGGCGPFSASSIRSQRHGTRFPSAEALHATALLKRNAKCDAYSAMAATRFGGTTEPKELKQVLAVRELDRVESSIASHSRDLGYLPAHSAIFPASQHEKTVAGANARVGKLRATYDKLVAERKAKTKARRATESEIAARETVDAHCASLLRRGEATLGVLDARLVAIRCALAESAALGSFYGDIAAVGEAASPARASSRLEIVEQQVELARVQATDLLKKRRELVDSSEATRAADLPYLRREKKKWAAMREVARLRLRLVRASLNSLHPKEVDETFLTAAPEPPAQTMTTTPADYFGGRAAMWGRTRDEPRRPATASREDDDGEDVVIWPPPDNEDEALLEELVLASGASEPKDIAAKYKEATELHASLEAQHRRDATRLAQLKTVFGIMTSEFKAMKIAGVSRHACSTAGDTTTIAALRTAQVDERDMVEDPQAATRRVDALLFRAEIRLHQTQRQAEQLALFVARACSGVLHVARLVRVHTSAHNPVLPSLEIDPDLVRAVECQGADKPLPSGEAIFRLLRGCEDTLVFVASQLPQQQRPTPSEQRPRRRLTKKVDDNAFFVTPEARCRATLVNQLDDADLAQHSHVTPGARVPTGPERDEHFVQVSQDLEARDADLDAREAQVVPEPNEKDADFFIQESLQTPAAVAALRHANALSKLKQGDRAPLGLAIHHATILVPKTTTSPRAKLDQTARPGKAYSEQVPDRGHMKTTASRTAAEAAAQILAEKLAAEQELQELHDDDE
ncbi:hypothetical protein CTAYLR_005011 [Chrysophaeum taylorii]|uniref:Uncharacterized protein n=1 Tax=Chrysophaeum taylorii TaxID=2483200 RepID=A0AAD7XKD9_9STRA|nr:hypothetical protein CTAYLR_005011 [Chrysophaeum taylorii]